MEVVSSTLQHREMKGSLVAIIILVLICATVFAVRKGIAARASAENWLVEKRELRSLVILETIGQKIIYRMGIMEMDVLIWEHPALC